MSDLALPRKSLKEIALVPHTPPNHLSPPLPRGSERNQRSGSDGLETQMGWKERGDGKRERRGRAKEKTQKENVKLCFKKKKNIHDMHP